MSELHDLNFVEQLQHAQKAHSNKKKKRTMSACLSVCVQVEPCNFGEKLLCDSFPAVSQHNELGRLLRNWV